VFTACGIKHRRCCLQAELNCPELPAADFYLFPQLKSAFKGQRFCDAPEITNAPEELKRLS